ncbi:MAG: helix-turn-helix transcriptional regulator [Clostridia bacterium]|nr:helix-turn-helix transcriptional regulator [Clostridia bacterium]
MDYRDMGRKIRSQRKAQGLTQERLAELLDISASFLGHIERGTRVASLDTLARLCNALHISPAYLMESALCAPDLDLPEDLTEKQKDKLNEMIALYCKQMRE